MSDSSDSSDASGSDSDSSQDPSFTPKYIAFKALSVDNVKSKFDEKAVISSSEFFSSVDPQPTSFILELTFGTQKHPKTLKVQIVPVNRNVRNESQRLKIRDDEAKRVGQFDVRYSLPLAKGFPFTVCKIKLKDIEDPKLEIWQMSFTLVYSKYYGMLPAPPRPSRLQRNLEKLFETGVDTDVTFLVQGEKFTAHKNLLSARCSYFERMFHSQMKESLSNEIEVTDISPAAFKGMLHFIYSGQTPEYSEETSLELLSAADKYGIDDLSETCETIICSNLQPKNVIDALLLAVRLGCTQLQAEATGVFKQYLHIVREEPSWGKLNKHPDLLLGILETFCY